MKDDFVFSAKLEHDYISPERHLYAGDILTVRELPLSQLTLDNLVLLTDGHVKKFENIEPADIIRGKVEAFTAKTIIK